MEPYGPFSEAVREDPYPYYAALRTEAPVYWAEEAQAWCVSRYDDVQFILRTPELFSSDAMRTMLMGARPGVNPLEDPEVMARALALTEALAFPLEELMAGRQLLSEDPPRHTDLRNIVNRGFTPRRITMWEPLIRDLAGAYVSDMRDAEEVLRVERRHVHGCSVPTIRSTAALKACHCARNWARACLPSAVSW